MGRPDATVRNDPVVECQLDEIGIGIGSIKGVNIIGACFLVQGAGPMRIAAIGGAGFC
jgi:Na+-translocating ferredoxin:NAD+ oxidoreductase RnfE subunit